MQLTSTFRPSALALALASGIVEAQDQPRKPRIVVDRNSAAIGTVLPFDEPFLLIGAAGTNLLRLEVWYADADSLPKESCDKLHPILKPDRAKTNVFGYSKPVPRQYTKWERNRAGADSFWVAVEHPLPPNRDYTFCLRSREAPSADDSARFQAKATELLRAALRSEFKRIGLASLDTLDLKAFRAALIAALPPNPAGKSRDITPGSVFDATATGPRLQDTFVELINIDLYRRDIAREVEAHHATASGNRTSLRSDVQALASSPVVVRLANTGVSGAKLGDNQEKRLQAAISLASTLATLAGDGRSAAAVAIGRVPLTSPRSAPPGIAVISDVSAAGELTPWIANIDTTIVRLQGLAELIAWLGSDGERMAAAGVTRADLDSVGRRVRTTIDDASTQGSKLRQLQEVLTSFETTTSALVTNVALRDLKDVGYYSTTTGSYDTRARWHISQDLGILYVWNREKNGRARNSSPYLGVNFYIRPVNKRAPMNFFNPLDLRRWSATVGVTTKNIDEDTRYKGIVEGKALVIGAGFRVTDYFRVSYGAPLVWTYTPDAARRKRLTALRYAAVSIDAELKTLISGIAGSLFPN